MSYPSTYSAWRRSEGIQAPPGGRLTIERSDNEANPQNLKPHDVVLKIHAVSLNYREIAMVIGTYPKPIESRGIPTSDAAAEVVAVGSAVSRFKVGDRVSPNPNIGDLEPDDDSTSVALGVNTSGVLREYAVFHEKHLVSIPAHLSWEEVSLKYIILQSVISLTCSGGYPSMCRCHSLECSRWSEVCPEKCYCSSSRYENKFFNNLSGRY